MLRLFIRKDISLAIIFLVSVSIGCSANDQTNCYSRPNPFSPQTSINFSVESPENLPVPVKIVIYNPEGKPVRVLIDEKKLPGKYSINWDGKDDNVELLDAGVYLFKLDIDEKTIRKGKMIHQIWDKKESDRQVRENSYPVSSSKTANFVINQQNENPVDIVIEIYDTEGELIHTIERKELASGSYTINWDGLTDDNHKVEQGYYFWKLIIDGRIVKKSKFYLEY